MAIGQIHNREKFLQRISSKLNRPKPEKLERPSWSYAPQHEVLKSLSQDANVNMLPAKNRLADKTAHLLLHLFFMILFC